MKASKKLTEEQLREARSIAGRTANAGWLRKWLLKPKEERSEIMRQRALARYAKKKAESEAPPEVPPETPPK